MIKMPYIKPEDRVLLDSGEFEPDQPGELNYILTRACLDYWDGSNRNYQAINDIIGALEGCKLEFYRRKAAPYEDTKIVQNGDVYFD